ncbi:MAG: PorV/PorQ family protein [Saprospiraceae bacterium]
MNRNFYFLLIILGVLFTVEEIKAGNPDRQGEAGASELLMNPWAKSSGIHSIGTSFVSGIESMRINVAGLGRIKGGELSYSNARLFEGSGMGMNALGFGIRIKESSVIGLSFTSLDFGDIPVTTVNLPEGTGGFLSPSFFNLALGYAYTYQNKISVGILFRGISEAIQDVSSFGFGIDAGVQYVSGEKDNFKLGITLNNIGSPMKFGGEGLSFQGENQEPAGGTSYNLTYNARAAEFELPSTLNLGVSYDFYFNEKLYLRGIANFTSNAFSRDQLGGGIEFSIHNMVVLRGAYKYDIGSNNDVVKNVYTGLAAGISVESPLTKGGKNNIGVDYAYRTTSPFKGTHNLGIRYAF